ncbi:hypothetical protein MUP37_04240, partial [Candidatus Bathyarchaeota archaeon]|nr:hypothetical protein [Candidatus Bathyarchaeota archaeon]
NSLRQPCQVYGLHKRRPDARALKKNECSIPLCGFRGLYCGRARGEQTICSDCPVEEEQMSQLPVRNGI